MAERNIKHVPVTSADGRALGVVTGFFAASTLLDLAEKDKVSREEEEAANYGLDR